MEDIPSNIVGLSNQKKMRIINHWGHTLSHASNDDGSFAKVYSMIYSLEGKGLYIKFMDSHDIDKNIDRAIHSVYRYILAIMVN